MHGGAHFYYYHTNVTHCIYKPVSWLKREMCCVVKIVGDVLWNHFVLIILRILSYDCSFFVIKNHGRQFMNNKITIICLTVLFSLDLKK